MRKITMLMEDYLRHHDDCDSHGQSLHAFSSRED